MNTARTVLLTGCTRGLGRALVERFAEGGHVVHGCGRSADALGDLRARHGSPHSFTAVDVSDAAAVDAWVAGLVDAGQVPDLVINNAALMNAQRPLWELPADAIDELLAVNVNGTAHVCRAVLPAMIARGRGVVVNLSSGWGRSASPQVAPYCASKWAVEGLSSALARELREVPGELACVALSPGVVDTDMLRTCLPETASQCGGPESWSRRAAPFLLALGPDDNGGALTCE